MRGGTERMPSPHSRQCPIPGRAIRQSCRHRNSRTRATPSRQAPPHLTARRPHSHRHPAATVRPRPCRWHHRPPHPRLLVQADRSGFPRPRGRADREDNRGHGGQRPQHQHFSHDPQSQLHKHRAQDRRRGAHHRQREGRRSEPRTRLAGERSHRAPGQSQGRLLHPRWRGRTWR